MPYLYTVTSKEDFEDYYKIKVDKIAILWSGFASAPDKQMLKMYFNNLLLKCYPSSDESHLVFIKEDGTDTLLGYSLMSRISDNTLEVSGYSILSEVQGRGYGVLLIKLSIKYAKEHGYKKLIAWISEKNIGSIKSCEKNGFKKTSEHRQVKLAAFDREDIFYKFICRLL